jgi:hypothetical protein
VRWQIFRQRFRCFGGRELISGWYGENWLLGSQGKEFFPLRHLVEGAGSRPDIFEAGAAQTGNNNMERDKNRSLIQAFAVL